MDKPSFRERIEFLESALRHIDEASAIVGEEVERMHAAEKRFASKRRPDARKASR